MHSCTRNVQTCIIMFMCAFVCPFGIYMICSYSVSVAINDVLQTVGTAKKGTLTHGLHGSNADNERSVKTAVVQEIDSGDMQSGDIARYIETHNTEKDDDLDLF